MQNPAQIRRFFRAQRRRLSKQQRRQNSLDATRHFIRNIKLIRAKRIALYLPADSEIDPRPLIRKLCRLNKIVFLPILRPGPANLLWFSEYRQGDHLRANRYGIPEPDHRRRRPVPTRQLDLVIMPLVAFSSDGTRLGMGGGYYDRTLAYQRIQPSWLRPKLLGYAHECQRVSTLPKHHWDIPLHAIITEKGYQAFVASMTH